MLTTLLGQSRTDSVRDVVLLACRVLLGAVLIAHGLQKLDNGHAATAAGFDAMGVPAPDLAAGLAIAVELGGGALLILGLLAPLAGICVALTMAGAFWYVHQEAGLFAGDGGWELVGVIGVAALALGLVPGRLSVDHLLVRRAG